MEKLSQGHKNDRKKRSKLTRPRSSERVSIEHGLDSDAEIRGEIGRAWARRCGGWYNVRGSLALILFCSEGREPDDGARKGIGLLRNGHDGH
jgi:hypothetical protein